MFYFEVCDCPKCGKKGTFLPSFEATLNDFLSIYDQGALLVLDDSNPPKSPEYIIFSCDEGCGFQKKMSDLEAMTFLREGWAKMAWKEWQKAVRNAAEFDKNFTRYILDGTIGKFISDQDLEKNPVLRDYVRAIRKNGET